MHVPFAGYKRKFSIADFGLRPFFRSHERFLGLAIFGRRSSVIRTKVGRVT